MSKYECQQCKETSVLPFVGGKCSKCGSLNIKNIDKQPVRKNKDASQSGKKSFLMVLLWGYIIYELWHKLH